MYMSIYGGGYKGRGIPTEKMPKIPNKMALLCCLFLFGNYGFLNAKVVNGEGRDGCIPVGPW